MVSRLAISLCGGRGGRGEGREWGGRVTFSYFKVVNRESPSTAITSWMITPTKHEVGLHDLIYN